MGAESSGGTVGSEGGNGLKRSGQVPRSPTGRIPQWAIDEAMGRESQHAVPWRSAPLPLPAAPTRRSRRRRRTHSPARALLAATVVVGAFAVAAYWGPSTWRVGLAPQLAARAANIPTPGHEEARQPLGTPAPLPTTSGSHRFTANNGTSPVAYDPCRPIHYVTRAQGTPPVGETLIRESVARVSAATGLKFIDDGATSEGATRDRKAYQPESYGNRWAPVLIVWTNAAENADFVGDVAGQAGSISLSIGDGPRVYVTGQIELDVEKFTRTLAEPDGANENRAVIEHELGHLVGLHHVADPTQLMYATNTGGVTDYAEGDLTGLAALGRGPCEPHL